MRRKGKQGGENKGRELEREEEVEEKKRKSGEEEGKKQQKRKEGRKEGKTCRRGNTRQPRRRATLLSSCLPSVVNLAPSVAAARPGHKAKKM